MEQNFLKLEVAEKGRPTTVKVKDLEKLMAKTLAVLKTRSRGGYVELFFITDTEMKKLNKKHRDKPKSTDVLSFSFIDHPTFPGDNLVGQIFISPKIAKKQAGLNSWSVSQEIEFLFVHALLHIFGYDHETRAEFKKMFDLHLKIMGSEKSAAKKVVEKYRAESF